MIFFSLSGITTERVKVFCKTRERFLKRLDNYLWWKKNLKKHCINLYTYIVTRTVSITLNTFKILLKSKVLGWLREESKTDVINNWLRDSYVYFKLLHLESQCTETGSKFLSLKSALETLCKLPWHLSNIFWSFAKCETVALMFLIGGFINRMWTQMNKKTWINFWFKFHIEFSTKFNQKMEMIPGIKFLHLLYC